MKKKKKKKENDRREKERKGTESAVPIGLQLKGSCERRPMNRDAWPRRGGGGQRAIVDCVYLRRKSCLLERVREGTSGSVFRGSEPRARK